jgi:hypothetical protein
LRTIARLSLVSLAILVVTRPASAQNEIVKTFHGYPWGTTLSAIPELAGKAPVGVQDELVVHTLQASFGGKPALAAFYFHPRTGALLAGAYSFVLTIADCEAIWEAVTGRIEYEYPTLVREKRIPKRTTPDQLRIYESDCEYYAYNSHIETWTASYVNPQPPGDRITLGMRTVERRPRLSVVFRGALGQAWATTRTLPPPGASPR